MMQLSQDPGRLFRRRILAQLTQIQLAQKAGLAKSTVSKAERGITSVRPDTLHVLAEALGCAVEDLMPIEFRVTS